MSSLPPSSYLGATPNQTILDDITSVLWQRKITNIARSEENRFWNVWILYSIVQFLENRAADKLYRYLDIILTEQ